MVHSYGAPIKTRDCPRQIEPIFQEHLSRAPLLFSSIRLGAEKRLETFSFRQQEKREREHPPPPPLPLPVQCPSRGGRRRTRRWRSCLIVQRGFVARQMPRTEAPPAAPPAPLLSGKRGGGWTGARGWTREATGKRSLDIYSAVGRGDPQKLAAIRSGEITG